jgi:peroxiredoxin Q/BCP
MSNQPYPAPNVVLPNETGKIIDLKNFRPNMIILFFYPRDNTSGCTREAKDFSENLKLFNKAKVNVFGISKDSIESHGKFIKKQDLAISLLSDQNGPACEDFGVWKEKSMYGKTYMGIERSTFIINGQGFIIKEWRKVKVNGHVKEVLEVIENYVKNDKLL